MAKKTFKEHMSNAYTTAISGLANAYVAVGEGFDKVNDKISNISFSDISDRLTNVKYDAQNKAEDIKHGVHDNALKIALYGALGLAVAGGIYGGVKKAQNTDRQKEKITLTENYYENGLEKSRDVTYKLKLKEHITKKGKIKEIKLVAKNKTDKIKTVYIANKGNDYLVDKIKVKGEDAMVRKHIADYSEEFTAGQKNFNYFLERAEELQAQNENKKVETTQDPTVIDKLGHLPNTPVQQTVKEKRQEARAIEREQQKDDRLEARSERWEARQETIDAKINNITEGFAQRKENRQEKRADKKEYEASTKTAPIARSTQHTATTQRTQTPTTQTKRNKRFGQWFTENTEAMKVKPYNPQFSDKDNVFEWAGKQVVKGAEFVGEETGLSEAVQEASENMKTLWKEGYNKK